MALITCIDSRLTVVKGRVIAHVPARVADQALIKYAHHEVLMPARVRDVVRCEPKWQGGLETETRIIARMPHQEQQAVSSLLHSFESCLDQGSADAAPLEFRQDANRSQGWELVDCFSISDSDQTISGVADDSAIMQRHLR